MFISYIHFISDTFMTVCVFGSGVNKKEMEKLLPGLKELAPRERAKLVGAKLKALVQASASSESDVSSQVITWKDGLLLEVLVDLLNDEDVPGSKKQLCLLVLVRCPCCFCCCCCCATFLVLSLRTSALF